MVPKLSKLYGTFSGLSRNMQDGPEIFDTIPKSSRNLLDFPEIFKNIGKSSRLSGNHQDFDLRVFFLNNFF